MIDFLDSSALNTENCRKTVNAYLEANHGIFGESSKLRKACEYALMNGGKRLRPMIVLMLAEALGFKADVSQVALSIEYFHTASLIADDLPCMDDDDERRSQPSLHRVFGESPALLVSYTLIAAGYSCIEKNVTILKNSALPFSSQAAEIGIQALGNATYNTGVNGATGGQFLDIFPPDLSLPTIREIFHKKTVSLFEIAFVYGWLFGGGDIQKISQVKQLASHFGMAFQIADDLDDMIQDEQNKRPLNMGLLLGKEKAQQLLAEEIKNYALLLTELQLDCPFLKNLIK